MIVAVFKNKVCVKGTKIFKKNVETALKAVPQQEFQECFQQWEAVSFG
jgi:hypothetical protein